jgi:hypothetical protein
MQCVACGQTRACQICTRCDAAWYCSTACAQAQWVAREPPSLHRQYCTRYAGGAHAERNVKKRRADAIVGLLQRESHASARIGSDGDDDPSGDKDPMSGVEPGPRKRPRDPGGDEPPAKRPRPSPAEAAVARELVPGLVEDVVLQEIFTRLSDADLIRLREVNRAWFHAAAGAVRDASPKLTALLARDPSLFSAFRNLRSMRFTADVPPFPEESEQYFPPSLASLYLNAPYHPRGGPAAWRHIRPRPQLTPQQLARLPQLTALHFRRTVHDWYGYVDALPALTNLRILKIQLTDLSPAHGQAVREALCQLPALTDLTGTPQLLDACFMSRLQKLGLKVNDDERMHLLADATQLVSLKINSVFLRDRPAPWSEYLSGFDQLQSLKVRAAPASIERMLPQVAVLPHLTRLSLESNDVDAVFTISVLNPNLTKLTVRFGDYKLTQNVLTPAAVRALTQLRTLKLEGIVPMDETAAALSALVQLERLTISVETWLDFEELEDDTQTAAHPGATVWPLFPRVTEYHTFRLDNIAALRAPLRELTIGQHGEGTRLLAMHGARLLRRLWPTLERVNGLPLEEEKRED